MKPLRFTIDFEVKSKKNSYQRSRNGGLYRARGAKENEEAIMSVLLHQSRAQGQREPIAGAVAIRICLPKSRMDIANQAETILDALQGGHGRNRIPLVIKDDRQAKQIFIEERPDQTVTTVDVWEIEWNKKPPKGGS